MFSPGLYTEGFNGTDASFGIEDHYPSSAFGDDLFWASTWLYRASINSIRNFNQSYYGEAMSTTMSLACALPACCFSLTMHVHVVLQYAPGRRVRGPGQLLESLPYVCRYGELDLPGVSWDYMNNLAVTHASCITDDVTYHLAAQSFIWDWICNDELVKYTRNGRAYFFDTPHLGSTAGAAAMAAVYIHKNKDSNLVREDYGLIKSVPLLLRLCTCVVLMHADKADGVIAMPTSRASPRSLRILEVALQLTGGSVWPQARLTACIRMQVSSALRRSRRATSWAARSPASCGTSRS